MNGEALNLCSWAYPVLHERALHLGVVWRHGLCPLHTGLSSSLCPKLRILKLRDPHGFEIVSVRGAVLYNVCTEVEEV